MPHRHELSDAQWARLAPLLPPHKPGRPRQDDRRIRNGMPWKLATGAPWRDLPERYGPWQSVYTRFRRWTRAGVFNRLFAALQRQADAAGQIDWELHFVDGPVIRAHQHAAGAKGGTRRRKRSGAARAGSAPKSTSAPKAAASRWPSCLPRARRMRRRSSRGACPRAPSSATVAVGPACARGAWSGTRATAAGPSGAAVVTEGFASLFLRKSTERRTGPFDRALYRRRHRVENLIARCKQFRSLATRYDKRGESYRALWVIALTILWINHVH